MKSQRVLWITILLTIGHEPVSAMPKVIFDTDIARIDSSGYDISDIDDLGALAILNALSNRGLCEILCIVTNSRSDRAVEMINAINTYYHNPNIPIGLKHGNQGLIVDRNGYSKYISTKFKHSQRSIDAPSATDLLRTVLSGAAEEDTVLYIHADCISSWDFLSISSLLASPPDQLAPLSGWEMFNQKVDQLITYIPCLPNHGVSDNCPPWSDTPTTNETRLQYFLDHFENAVVGNSTAVAEVHLPTKLWMQPDSNPVKMAYQYYYTNTPPPWHHSAKIPESISIYGDGLGIFYLVGGKFTSKFFIRENHGRYMIDAEQKLRWTNLQDKEDHSYFYTKPETQKKLWKMIDELICHRPE